MLDIPVFIAVFTFEEKRKYRKISVSDMILRDKKKPCRFFNGPDTNYPDG